MVYPIKVGNRDRWSYARLREVLDMPNLIEIQQNSYQWFLDEGLREMFRDISPIQDFTGNLVLEFIDYSLGEPKYEVEECKERDVTYAAPLRVKVRLINKETGEVKEQEVFMGDFPLMTDKGTFIINGAERVIVSQLVRSPGVYYAESIDASGKKLYGATIIPNRGAWLEFETDINDNIFVRVDRTRKLPATVLVRSLGYSTNGRILEAFEDNEYIRVTLERDNTESTEEALVEIYKRLRPGEPPTVESAKALLESLFFDSRRYDLAKVGRYKLNKKLNLDIPMSVRNLTTEDIIASISRLLKIIEGTTASVPPKGGRKHPQQDFVKVDTSNILFICGGTFNGLEQIINRRMGSKLMGFGAKVKKETERSLGETLRHVQPEDLIKFGLIPEFLGRLPVIATLDELSAETLVRILTEPKNALIKQYKKLFEIEGVNLRLTDSALSAIADEALKRKSGARGLRAILESCMLDIMYDIPSKQDVKECVIGEEVVMKKEEPILLYEPSKKQA